jgi:hypothetical protein
MNSQNSFSNPDSGLIIGFSGTYYCLWSWATENNYSMMGSGSYIATSSYTKYYYIKRISTDLNKVKELYPNLSIDMGLHGQRWITKNDGFKREVLADDVFPYDFRGVGNKIMECNEVKFLWSLYLSNYTGIGRNKVYARKRLVELGLLVPYKTSRTIDVMRYDHNLSQEIPTGEVIVIRSSYSSPKYIAKIEAAKSLVRGHFYDDAKRIKLNIKEIKSFNFSTQYGTCYIVEYVDADNRVFKYKGSNPPSISKEDFDTVQATIKHGEYKGQLETTIQRIKVLSLN